MHISPQRANSLGKALRHFQSGKLVNAHKLQKLLADSSGVSGDPSGPVESVWHTVLVIHFISIQKRQRSKAVGDTVLHEGSAPLEAPVIFGTHKCTRTRGSFLPQGVARVHSSQACVGENRQHLCGVSYNSPGWTMSLRCAVSRWPSSYWLGHGPVLHLWGQFTSQLWQQISCPGQGFSQESGAYTHSRGGSKF